MLVPAITETSWGEHQLATSAFSTLEPTNRIMAALGLPLGGWPKVGEDTLARYYAYLSAKMSLPFTAYYPKPKNADEESQFRCTVLELFDPSQQLGDEIDGIFCRTRKGRFEVNLPLVELYVPHNSYDFQLVEDYGNWFWNWR